MKKIRLIFPVILFVLILAQGALQAAPDLEKPLKKVKLPNKEWTFKDPDKENQRILHPIKVGEAVNIRVHSYDVPVSAKAFLEQVRLKIIEKPDYQGAEVQLLKSETVKGKTWENFNIKRKDEINQQIWGIKFSSDVVVMVIYTGAGDYFKEYYDNLKKVLEKLS
jgi:hypothetical protein